MSEKHILLADPDAKAGDDFRQALGPGWVVKSIDTGAGALEALKTNNYQALIASLRLTDMSTAQLLTRVRAKYPQVIRFVVATRTDRERAITEPLGAHQFLMRPFDPESLRRSIEAAVTSDRWVASEPLRRLIGRMRTLPTIPALYLQIASALKSPDSTTEEVGELIGQDMAITTKLLQVINSAFFGLARTITSPAEAVGLLGFEIAKSMVLAVKLLNQYDRIKTGSFSIDALWHHCTAVAHNARRLVLLHTGERGLADEAFAAGLLHDVGKAILAGNFGEQYAGVESLARKQQLSIFQVEKEIFGAHHGQVGAYLLSLWGLPASVLDATALHHEPARSSTDNFSVLTAVHVADVLQYVACPDPAGAATPKVDKDYVARLGASEYFAAWCDELLGPEAAARYLETEQSKESTASLPQEMASSTSASSMISASESEAAIVAEAVANDHADPDEAPGSAAPGAGKLETEPANQAMPTPAEPIASLSTAPAAPSPRRRFWFRSWSGLLSRE